jgi:sulfate adenylyltransferase subunit 1
MDAVLSRPTAPRAPGTTAAATGAPSGPLRFLTAGSVDDGKSTLIGRLLLDGQALLADQLDALGAPSSGAELDLALATDGLEAEREQGITIDVAHRSFATPRRKFIVADAPGHEQYTRNMVTAAAGSDAAVVLVDVLRLGTDSDAPVALLPQTRRHALVARLLGVPHLVFAVNKLDALADPATAFDRARVAIEAFAAAAGFVQAGIVPISALRGDNVARRSAIVPAYHGPSLLELLESLPSAHDLRAEAAAAGDATSAALPVQLVVGAAGADGAAERVRVLWGRVATGRFAVGDRVRVLPDGGSATVAELHAAGGTTDAVAAGRSAGLVLDRQLDVSRGDWIVSGEAPRLADAFEATLAWLDVEPATPGRRLWFRHGNRWVQGRIAAILGRVDIETLRETPAEALAANDLARVTVELQEALPLAAFAHAPVQGALVLVDPATSRTSGVALVSSLG